MVQLTNEGPTSLFKGGEGGINDLEETEGILEVFAKILESLRQMYHQHWLGLNLTMPQLKVLLILSRQSQLTSGKLANLLGITPPTATGILDRLVAQGLVRRQEDPTDRRVVRLGLTEAGQGLVDKLFEQRDQVLRNYLEEMQEEDKEALRQGLQAFYRAIVGREGFKR